MKWIWRSLLVALFLSGCSFSGGGAGGKEAAFVILSLLRFQAAADSTTSLTTLRVDLETDSANEEVFAVLQLTRKTPTVAVTAPTALDAVTVQRYTVSYSRADGGQVPAPLTNVPTNIFIPAPPTDPAAAATTVTAPVLVFRGTDKLVPPFSLLQKPNEIFVIVTVTFTGFDLRGNEVNTPPSSLVINFFRSA